MSKEINYDQMIKAQEAEIARLMEDKQKAVSHAHISIETRKNWLTPQQIRCN